MRHFRKEKRRSLISRPFLRNVYCSSTTGMPAIPCRAIYTHARDVHFSQPHCAFPGCEMDTCPFCEERPKAAGKWTHAFFAANAWMRYHKSAIHAKQTIISLITDDRRFTSVGAYCGALVFTLSVISAYFNNVSIVKRTLFFDCTIW